MEKLSVLIADDHPLYRDGVVATLEAHPEIEVVAAVENADEARLAAIEHAPQVVILDISMPGGGLEAVREIGRVAPDAAIVMLTVSEAQDDIIPMLEEGVVGYVLKGVGGAELVEIVRGAAAGRPYVTPTLAAQLLSEQNRDQNSAHSSDEIISQLTEREREVLDLLSCALSNKEIAIRLNLQEKTVKHHVTNILKRLGARNRVHAAIMRHSSKQHPFASEV